MLKVRQQLNILKSLLWIALVALPSISLAVGRPGPGDPSWDERLTRLSQYEGRIIDTIIIENRNVYDTTRPNRNTFLFKTANKLHTVTRKEVIRRELLIQEGGAFDLELARETTRNLRTRYELYDAQIRVEEGIDSGIVVYLETIDQWSTFVKMHLTKESDKSGYKVNLSEHNLAGYNQRVSFDVINPGDEKAYFIGKFSDQRFVGFPYSLSFEYNDNPESVVRNIAITRPYYNLNQRWSFGMGLTNIQGRRDFWDDAFLVAQSYRDGDRFSSFVEYRWGSYHRKIGLNFGYTYFFERSFDKDTILPERFLEGMIPSDTVYHFFKLESSLSNIVFLRLARINGMGYPEDIIGGNEVRLSYGRAFRPDFDDHLYDQVNFTGTDTRVWKDNLAIARIRRAHWIQEGGDIQTLTEGSLRWYNFSLDFMTAAVQLRYQKLTRADQLRLLPLGGLTGIRGYDEFYLSGSERLVVNAESRLFANIDILSVLFGGVIFFDAGQIWSDYRPVSDPGWHHSVGLGLRISAEKSSRAQIVRIDLARAQEGDWSLLFGTGQYF